MPLSFLLTSYFFTNDQTQYSLYFDFSVYNALHEHDDDVDDAFIGNQYAKVLEIPGSEGPYATVTINEPRTVLGIEVLGENPYTVPAEESPYATPAGEQDYWAPALPPRGSLSGSDDDTKTHNYVNQSPGKNRLLQ